MQSVEAMTVSESRPLSGKVVRSGAWAGLRCHDVVYEPQLRLTAHAHELPFFAVSLCGEYEENTGRTRFEYASGTAVFHAANEEHAVQIGRNTVRCFVVEVDAETVEQRFACALPQPQPQPGGEAPAILTAMYREFRVSDDSAALSLQGLLLQLIASVSRSGDNDRGGHPPFLDRLEDFLRAHYRSSLTLEQMAASVGTSPARLSAAFRAAHGHSIADEQRRLRIEHACRLMLEPSVSLAEIALECGFADQPHFSRAFRRMKGVTPARYRAMAR